MLNGKFYTGLPPKMLERTIGTPNRLESHLFWPDDTQVDTAHETRTKRRSSLQTERPREVTTSYQRQSSWTGNGTVGVDSVENEVDTKQRFHKEFAKSSIKFFDNIQEEDYVGNRNAYKTPARRNLKKDVTTKPTAIKMQLPNNTNNAQSECAAIKNKQAFASKIQFYDYVDDASSGPHRRHNQIKPKMDMNDKKEVERHTKNSPKLQVKGIDRNLRLVDEQRNYERERRLTPTENYAEENYEETAGREPRRGARVIRNEVLADTRSSNLERPHNNKRYESPQRDRHSNYRKDYEENDYAYNERRAIPRRAENLPKKILKHPNNYERDYNENYNENNNVFERDLEGLEHTTRNIRFRDSPKKHVSYGDEVYEYEANNDNYHDDDNKRDIHNNYRQCGEESKSTPRSTARNGTITTHNSSRSEIKSINRQTTGKNERHRNEDQQQVEDVQIERNNQNRIVSKTNTKNHQNLYNNNNDNSKLNNQRHQQQQQQQQRRSTPKMSLSLSSTAADANDLATSPISPTFDSQKHLRSSLGFHGGEIVANNNDRDGTPTSDSGSRHRTARSAATTRRICVGLPD